MSDTAAVSDIAAVSPIITVDRVVRRFGEFLALREVSLTVQPGEFVVIGGPSGAGKSTLLHLLAALDTPTSGSIEVNGHRLGHHAHQLSHFRRLEVGIIFQLHNLVPRLSARQNVELVMFGTNVRRRQRRQRAEELLEQVGLGSKIDAKPPTMSGGERQRVAIARALANHPPVLLADEPTGSLDDDSAEVVILLLERLRAETNMTIVAVSHDARLDRRADRRVALVSGAVGAVDDA